MRFRRFTFLTGLIFVGLFVFNGCVQFQKRSVDSLIPQGAVGYVRVVDLETHLDAFLDSQFYRTLKTLDIKAATGDEEFVRKYEEFMGKLTELLRNPVLDDFLGSDVVVAGYNYSESRIDSIREVLALDFKAEDGADQLDRLLPLVPDLLAAVRVSAAGKAITALSAVLGSWDPDVEITSNIYNKIRVNRARLTDNFSIYYFLIDDLLAVSFDEQRIRSAVDCARKDIPSLVHEDGHSEALHDLSGNIRAAGYLNFPQFMTGLEKFYDLLLVFIDRQAREQSGNAPQIPTDYRQKMQTVLDNLSGFGYMSWYWLDQGPEGELVFSRTRLDVNAISDDVADYFRNAPSENRTLDLVPAGVLGYFWSGNLNTSRVWEQVAADMPVEKREEIAVAFKQRTGLDFVEGVLPALGNEFGYWLQSIDSSSMFSVPRMVVFLKANHTGVIRQLLESVNGMLPQPLEQMEHNGTNIRFMRLPIPLSLAAIAPGYCFVEDYLLVGLHYDDLLAALDVKSGDKLSLQESKHFMPFSSEPVKGYFNMSYLDVTNALRQTRDMVDKSLALALGAVNAGQGVTDGRKENAVKAAAAARHLVLPIMDSFMFIESISGVSGKTDDSVTAHTHIRTAVSADK
jgi:hypothetical protein